VIQTRLCVREKCAASARTESYILRSLCTGAAHELEARYALAIAFYLLREHGERAHPNTEIAV
jgi:hypothetical protein